jgi:hypothetical protein
LPFCTLKPEAPDPDPEGAADDGVGVGDVLTGDARAAAGEDGVAWVGEADAEEGAGEGFGVLPVPLPAPFPEGTPGVET